MFREVSRNKKQILSTEKNIEILKNAKAGVLNLLGDNDYPYGVPMSYSFVDGKLFLHSAKKGHKIDAIKKHEKVSFTVIETDQIMPKEFTTYYRSVIVFGKAHIIDDQDEMRAALKLLVEKYSSDFIEEGNAEIESLLNGVSIIVIEAEHISGKEAIEFAEGNKAE